MHNQTTEHQHTETWAPIALQTRDLHPMAPVICERAGTIIPAAWVQPKPKEEST